MLNSHLQTAALGQGERAWSGFPRAPSGEQKSSPLSAIQRGCAVLGAHSGDPPHTHTTHFLRSEHLVRLSVSSEHNRCDWDYLKTSGRAKQHWATQRKGSELWPSLAYINSLASILTGTFHALPPGLWVTDSCRTNAGQLNDTSFNKGNILQTVMLCFTSGIDEFSTHTCAHTHTHPTYLSHKHKPVS